MTTLTMLRAAANPRLSTIDMLPSVARLTQILRDGCAAQRPRARDFDKQNFEADAAYIHGLLVLHAS